VTLSGQASKGVLIEAAVGVISNTNTDKKKRERRHSSTGSFTFCRSARLHGVTSQETVFFTERFVQNSFKISSLIVLLFTNVDKLFHQCRRIVFHCRHSCRCKSSLFTVPPHSADNKFQTLNEHCGLVIRVSGYRSRGPGFYSWSYQIF
jgi:hypothetical protein